MHLLAQVTFKAFVRVRPMAVRVVASLEKAAW
jgi:hypothetical protein